MTTGPPLTHAAQARTAADVEHARRGSSAHAPARSDRRCASPPAGHSVRENRDDLAVAPAARPQRANQRRMGLELRTPALRRQAVENGLERLLHRKSQAPRLTGAATASTRPPSCCMRSAVLASPMACASCRVKRMVRSAIASASATVSAACRRATTPATHARGSPPLFAVLQLQLLQPALQLRTLPGAPKQIAQRGPLSRRQVEIHLTSRR